MGLTKQLKSVFNKIKIRCVIFGDESTIPEMLDILGESVKLTVVASNRPQAFDALSGNKEFKKLLRIQPKKISNDHHKFLEELRLYSPDYFFCFSYSMILNQDILDIPHFGVINIHGGLLPEFRGANIYNWALIEDAKETGMTAHFMQEGIDDGDIIFQKKVPVLETDTAKTLRAKINPTGFEMLKEIKNMIERGEKLPRTPQDESKSKYYRRRNPEDGLIDWTKPDREIFNLVRALVDPWPGAFFYDKQGKKITLRKYHSMVEIKQLREIYGT